MDNHDAWLVASFSIVGGLGIFAVWYETRAIPPATVVADRGTPSLPTSSGVLGPPYMSPQASASVGTSQDLLAWIAANPTPYGLNQPVNTITSNGTVQTQL